MFQFYERIRPFLNDEYRVMPCPKMFLNGSCGIYIVEYLHAIFSVGALIEHFTPLSI